MDSINITEFRKSLLENLTENILPYWLNTMQDPAGGFYGRRDGHDALVAESPKGAILNARLLWTFSAAYRALKRPEYLEAARRARSYILERFIDPEYGGVFWSLNADGSPLDTKKQFYAIAFTIYGLAEWIRAVGDDSEALEVAMSLFHAIETHSRDRKKHGYIEATTRSWQPIADMRLSEKDDNASKTMNTHLHILEGYTNLLRVAPTPEVREAVKYLLSLHIDRLKNSRTHHLGLFFNDDWHCTDGGAESYGHDIEASWLMLEAADVVCDSELRRLTLDATRHIADAGLQGRCVDGSLVYERHANGHYDNEKHWWVQAEALVGQLYLWKFHNRPEALAGAYQTWRYILENIVDPQGGEWLWSRLPNGSENRRDDKAGFWKCPYHNSRACLEAAALLA